MEHQNQQTTQKAIDVTLNADDGSYSTTATNEFSKENIRKGGVVVHANNDLETRDVKNNASDTNSNKKAGFFASTVVPLFYKEGKPTGLGYGTAGAIGTYSIILYFKHKKERKWSAQRVTSGVSVVPLVLNTDSSHIKGMLNV